MFGGFLTGSAEADALATAGSTDRALFDALRNRSKLRIDQTTAEAKEASQTTPSQSHSETGTSDPTVGSGDAVRLVEQGPSSVGAKPVEAPNAGNASMATDPRNWSQELRFWNEPRNLGNEKVGYRRVFQRNDLFDPTAVHDGLSNLELMAKGRPPIGYDGQPVTLHHLIQNEPGSLAEVGGQFHSDNTRVLHGLTEPKRSFRYSPDGATTEAEKAFNRYKYWYWKQRARGLQQ